MFEATRYIMERYFDNWRHKRAIEGSAFVNGDIRLTPEKRFFYQVFGKLFKRIRAEEVERARNEHEQTETVVSEPHIEP